MLSTLRKRALAGLRARVRQHTSARLDPLDQVRDDAPQLAATIAALEARIGRLEQRRASRNAPFSAEMTVHAAWTRHPRVADVFAARGLPDCPACAVGQDETLAEVADGYEFPLQILLAELEDAAAG